MRSIFNYLKGDKVLWMATILLLLISIISVYSFIPILIKVRGGSPFSYLFKHVLYVGLGFYCMYWIHRKKPLYIQKSSKFIFYAAIALLLFTFFFGVNINNATRWVRIPIVGITFQTSDLARYALIIFLSQRLVTMRGSLDSWKQCITSFFLPILLICAFIAIDNLSTAGLLFMVALTLLFVAKFPFSKIAGFVGSGIALFGVVILINLALPSQNILPRFDTWVGRISDMFIENETPPESVQAINAKLAIFNGGFTGVGVGNGDLKKYIPQAYADFYYASFVEEFGLFGAIVLIVLYLILFFRVLQVALHSETMFGTYVAIGIGLILLSQAIINMFVCTGLMPVTGQVMPFLSMGGSAMLMSCAGLGIVQSIANKENRDKNGKSLSSSTNKLKDNDT